MSVIKVIADEKDYQEALSLLKSLLGTRPSSDSEDGQKAKMLAILIEKYESERFPIELPTPIEAIEHRMEQLDLKPADLVPHIGSPSRVSEVLSGKRKLTMAMARNLEAHLKIPATVLLRPATKKQADLNPPPTFIIKATP